MYDVDATTGTVHKRWRLEITTPSINQVPLDHNADGRAEVVISTYDASSATWTLKILDGDTGESLATLDGAALSRIGPDLKGDGTRDIVVSYTDAYPLPAFDDFHTPCSGTAPTACRRVGSSRWSESSSAPSSTRGETGRTSCWCTGT